jgi:hypothetical protein
VPATIIGAVFVLLLVGLPTWASWRARARLLARMREEWGRPCERERDLDAIADLYRVHDGAGDTIDDRTWNDLLLDDVFAYLDRTQSAIGQQMLYRRLRSASSPRALHAFDALAMRAAADDELRERAQQVLARLRPRAACFVHRLTRPDAIQRRGWHVVFPVWSAAILATLVLAVWWSKLLAAVLLAFLVNRAVQFAIDRQLKDVIVPFRQIGPVLLAAGQLAAGFTDQETSAITGTLDADLMALQRLGAIAQWVSRDPLATDDLTFMILELLNGLFLIDANAVYIAGRELQRRAPHLLRVIEAVGEIDAAISVASFRRQAEKWSRPTFGEPGARAVFAGLRHPLVEDAVPNSIELAPPHGMLVTGSNMSGKSTFLRTVGVNVVLAQTIHTCLADVYDAPIYRVRSCIGRTDDLLAGKSYYLVEVESVIDLVRASDSAAPHLFLLDELFRGTNAVERVAAGVAVLAALIGAGKPHLVLAATHDSELVDQLHDDGYLVCHLSDAVGADGLVFDYRVQPGPATSRNAITLLELSGAPKLVVTRALALAAALDRQRERARTRP